MHTRMLLGMTALVAAMTSGIPVGHADSIVDQVQHALGNGTPSDRSENAYQQGREDQQRREEAQRERRRETREQRQRSMDQYPDDRYYRPQQQRGS